MNRWVLAATLLLACASPAQPEVGAVQSAMVVPGPWNPPEGVRRAAAAQYVEVVDPPNVRPHGRCPDPNPFSACTHPACTRAHPGTTELDEYIRMRWPGVRPYGTYYCRRNSNNLDELSVHAIGRAIDAGIPLIGTEADNTLGDAVGNWLIANAEYIGIQRVGWDGMWWNGERGFLPMRGDPHKNHLHIELSVDGAARRTRFFVEGPPPETCPVVCYGHAAVAEDCSYVDCAAMGQVCMSDPVRCETAAPPEPPEARFEPDAPRPTLSPLGGLARFTFLGPERVFDTRTPADSTRLVRSDMSTGPLSATVTGDVMSWPSLPADASGVWLNLAALRAPERGHVVAYPSGPRPMTSSVNYEAGEVRSNAAPLAFPAGGTGVTFAAITQVDLVTDLFGAFTESGEGFRAAGPTRVDDTRAVEGPIPAESEHAIDVRAPDGASGVSTTIAVIASEAGFLTAYECGTARPLISSLNFAEGVTAGAVISRLDGEGRFCVYSSSDVELVVDVTGYWSADGELSYQALAPVRLLDTRDEDSRFVGRLADRQVVDLPIQSLPGAPENVYGAVVNLTVLGFDGPGHVTTFPCGFEPPLTSSLNYGSGAPRPVIGSVAMAPVGEDGDLCVTSLRRTHLIVDLVGVWVPTPGGPPPMPPTEPDPTNPELPEMPDAGPGEGDGGVDDDDGGLARDAGSSPDAARPVEPVAGGCACRSPGGTHAPWLAMFALLLYTRRMMRRDR